MSLDVYLKKDGKQVYWCDEVMNTFPLGLGMAIEPCLDMWGEETGEGYTVFLIDGMTGMSGRPDTTVSFRGWGYTYFGDKVLLPNDLSESLTVEQVRENAEVLQQYLLPVWDMDENTSIPLGAKDTGFTFDGILPLWKAKIFCTFLTWAAEQNIELVAIN